MRARVVIEVSPTGDQTVIRIAATQYRRLVDSIKMAALTLVLLLGVSLLHPENWARPAAYLTFIGVLAVLAGLVSFARPGETIYVTASEVRILRPLESYLVSRDDQMNPTYSPVPKRLWFAQRWENERGSGVMLFGTPELGVRFGVDLDEVQAAQVLGAFTAHGVSETRPIATSGLVRRWVRLVSWLASMIVVLAMVWLPLSFNLSWLAAIVLGSVVFAGLVYVLDLVERRFPERVRLG